MKNKKRFSNHGHVWFSWKRRIVFPIEIDCESVRCVIVVEEFRNFSQYLNIFIEEHNNDETNQELLFN